VLHHGGLCGTEEDCPDRIFRCRLCGYSAQTELDGCPACAADWKTIDVSHGPGCPKNIGLTITLADITEEEFRVLELIEAERQEQMKGGQQT
jgi:hypothetical protein